MHNGLRLANEINIYFWTSNSGWDTYKIEMDFELWMGYIKDRSKLKAILRRTN